MSDAFDRLDSAEQTARMTLLARAALPHWGLEGSDVALIKFRENAVFSVHTPQGERYALRIHRAGYHSDDALRSELQWIAALDAAGIRAPAVLPTRDGALFARVAVEGVPEERQVDLFEWVSGDQLGALETGLDSNQPVENVYGTLGELAARLHNQATTWELPRGFSRHAWDADALAGSDPLWGRFWELEALTDAERDLLVRARDQVHADLRAYHAAPENSGRYSMIHADLVAENVLVDGDTVRLIDFDDAGFGWHLFELATVFYFDRDEDHYPKAFEALVEGYRRHRDLPDSQLAHMQLFFTARSFTYLGWVHTRPETETARTMTAMLITKACAEARAYLGTE